MIFTLEALYTLHIFNNYSDDLVFLPLPAGSSKNRKENLLSVIEKGFEDLKEMGLIVDNQPTEECAQYGAYLKEYHDANYHCQVDQRLSYAPGVDAYKRMAIIIMEVGDNQFQLDRAGSAVFLAFLMEMHPVLQDVDDTIKDYIHSQWEGDAFMRLMVHHGNDEAIRIRINEFSKDTQDTVYLTSNGHLYEYDLSTQMRRSIDSEQLKTELIQKLKVRM